MNNLTGFFSFNTGFKLGVVEIVIKVINIGQQGEIA